MKKELPSQLDFQNVINIEENFAELCNMIQIYMTEIALFWTYIQNTTVNLSEMRRIADHLFDFKALMN